MAHKGKSQLLITFVVTPDKVAEVDRVVASHGSWMAEGHHREGPKALLKLQFFQRAGVEKPARSYLGADRQYALRAERDLRVLGGDRGPLAAGPKVLAGFFGDGGHHRHLQPSDPARGRDRPVALVIRARPRPCHRMTRPHYGQKTTDADQRAGLLCAERDGLGCGRHASQRTGGAAASAWTSTAASLSS